MKLLNFTIIKLTICLIIGILIGYFIPECQNYAMLASIILSIVLFTVLLIANKPLKTTIGFGLLSYFTLITIGIASVTIHNQKRFASHYSHHFDEIKDSTTTISFSIREVLKSGRYNDKYVINILEINAKTVNGKSLLNITLDSLNPSLKIDEVYKTNIQFKPLTPPLNPNQFDYKTYLEKQYIYHQIFTNSEKLFKTNSKRNTIFGWADNIRQHINSKLKPYHFKPDELAVINALLLGQRQDLSEDVYTSYVNAGAIHILAVSGLHVGILLILLSFLLKPLEQLKNGRFIKMIILIALLWSFAIIAGLSASVTRAVTMFSIVAIALHLKRPTNIYNTLAISIFIILLFKPLFLFDVGFQLSYLAVFAIVAIDPLLYKLVQTKVWVLDKLWHTLTVTLSAQFGIIPISLFYFHQFPSLFFISNLVIIPILGIILGMGVFIICLATLNMLPQLLADVYGCIITNMNNFVGWIAQQNDFLFTNIPFNLLYVIVTYLFIISLVRLFIKRNYITLRFVLISIIVMQLAVIITSYNTPKQRFIIFHKSRHTLLGQLNNNAFNVAHDLKDIETKDDYTIKNYTIGNHISTIKTDPIKPVYFLNDKTVLVIDSLGAYNIKSFQPDYILLRQSPKLNLNRLIDSIKPKQIIADGSNYKSYITHWKTICKKRKLPFHHTNEMGAFIIDY